MSAERHEPVTYDETARFYTRSRRYPRMIGRLPEGTRLWGGPYTFTQLGLGVLAICLAAASRELWSTGSILTDFAITLGAGWAAAFLGRYAPIGSMHPLVAANAAIRCIMAPRGGRYRGLPLPPHHRPRRARARVTISCGRAGRSSLPHADSARPHVLPSGATTAPETEGR